MIQATKAIVLKTIKYGETSLIVHLYTELHGVQTCLIQGVRKSTKKVAARSNYFMVGNLLQISMYYQPAKKMQRIRDFQFDEVHINISNSIVKNAIILLMMEVVHHTLHEPEPNEDLYGWLQSQIIYVENAQDNHLTWMPHYFCVQYAAMLGFGIQGSCSIDTPILHLNDGMYVSASEDIVGSCSILPQSHVIDILNQQSLQTLPTIHIATANKRLVLRDIIIYFKLHIAHMQSIKSIAVLESVFGE
jgi:DNA repair protein RecO (recombination protein O)